MKNKFLAKFFYSFSSFLVAVSIIFICVLIASAIVFPLWLWATYSGKTYTVFVGICVLALIVWKLFSCFRKSHQNSKKNIFPFVLRWVVLAAGLVAMFFLVVSGGRFFGVLAFGLGVVIYAIIPTFFSAEKK